MTDALPVLDELGFYTLAGQPASSRDLVAEVIDGEADLTIIRSQSGDFTVTGGKQVMETFLKAEPGNIHAVYAHNDDMALGAIQAIEEAGLKPGQDIIIVSIDGVRQAFEAMQAGKLNATVECNPLLGPLVFDALEQLAAGETLPKHTVVEDRIFTQDDVTDEVIAGREY